MSSGNSARVHSQPDKYRDLRSQMVERQLRSRGIRDARVLGAMARVPRHLFVPIKWRDSAYADHALPIGFRQTISQPFIVAFMCEAAKLSGRELVLEVGAGSGYGAAVLSQLAAEVHTVERIPELAEQARDTLSRLGYENVSVHLADGSLGWPEAGPYDAIVVTAGAEALPKPYLKQLAKGGRIIIPIGMPRHGQTMYRIGTRGTQLISENLGGCAFVPLIGKFGSQLD